MDRYIVLRRDSIDELALAVNAYVRQKDYEPRGGIVGVPTNSNSELAEIIWAQALWKRAAVRCRACPACQHPYSPNIGHADGCPCYDVTCARCGKHGTCCVMYVEEGDEWECPPCWERCEAQQRADEGKSGE